MKAVASSHLRSVAFRSSAPPEPDAKPSASDGAEEHARP